MAVYLIDYENVNKDGLNGVSKLTEKDRVIIFYSAKADRMTFGLHRRLNETLAAVEYKRVDVGGHNALDFQLATYLGFLLAKDSSEEYCIVSNDRGFEYLAGFWRRPLYNVTRTREIATSPQAEERRQQKRHFREDKPGFADFNDGGRVDKADGEQFLQRTGKRVEASEESERTDLLVIEQTGEGTAAQTAEPASVEREMPKAEPVSEQQDSPEVQTGGMDYGTSMEESDFENQGAWMAEADSEDQGISMTEFSPEDQRSSRAPEDSARSEGLAEPVKGLQTGENTLEAPEEFLKEESGVNPEREAAEAASQEESSDSEQTDSADQIQGSQGRPFELRWNGQRQRSSVSSSEKGSETGTERNPTSERSVSESENVSEDIFSSDDYQKNQDSRKKSSSRRRSGRNQKRNQRGENTPADSQSRQLSDSVEACVSGLELAESERGKIADYIERYKTKLGLNNALVRQFGTQKAGEIYKLIKPLIRDKKGSVEEKTPSQEEEKILREVQKHVAGADVTESERKEIASYVQRYKTKQGLNNALVRQFGSQKAGVIYKMIKPLLSGKKDKNIPSARKSVSPEEEKLAEDVKKMTDGMDLTEEDLKEITSSVQRYKTRQGVNNALVRRFRSQKAGEIYKVIKPLLKEKKGRNNQ